MDSSQSSSTDEHPTIHEGTIESLFDFPFDRFGRLWFRGQACEGWELRPGLLRREAEFGYDKIVTVETPLNQEFRRHAARYLAPSVRDSLVELYFQAQHAGFPTRLRDWTTNPLAGVFFAVEETGEDDCTGGALFALDVAHLYIAEETQLRLAIETLFRSIADVSKSPFWSQKPDAPLAVQPDLREGRMAQQSSRFTFHFGIDDWPQRAVHQWTIPRRAKRKILYQLESLNVTRATLFPDLDNLARHFAKGLDPSLRSYVFGEGEDV